MCGTPNFISPEVASRGSHGLEADVWGLGCLLYTLLVGTPPFDTQAVRSTLTRVVMASYELPTHLSREAKDLINALLQKNPKDRLRLEQILEHPFIKRNNVSIHGFLKFGDDVSCLSIVFNRTSIVVMWCVMFRQVCISCCLPPKTNNLF